MSVLDASEIMELIPNRYPILFMDKVDELILVSQLLLRRTSRLTRSFSKAIFLATPLCPAF